MFCMKHRRYNLGSLIACLKPSLAPLSGVRPTVSRLILASARIRSSSVSHFVVSGKSGRRYAAAMATAKVTTPSIIKSLEEVSQFSNLVPKQPTIASL